jgi:hypothetical protein
MLKILSLFLAGMFVVSVASGQANAFINILTQNSGIVNLGQTGYIQVDVGNTGPGSIGMNKVRAQISVPSAIVTIPTTQSGLPAGWIITNNTGSAITICNGTDIIDAGTQRTILIALQTVAVGGPSTVAGVLSFGPGTGVCTGPGSLPGDNVADNTSTSSIRVVPAPSCTLTGVSASAGTITCNGGTTTLTATPAGTSSGIQYSLDGATFQAGNTFTVTAGTYTITARETATPACVATAPAIIITDPPVVAAPVPGNIIQPGCTTATGSVELTGLPAGNWTINPGAITGSGAATIISNLATNTYSFTVTDAAGCTSAPSSNVTINSQPATPVTPTIGTISQPTCTVSTGTVVLDGLPAGNWTINPGAVTGNTASTTVGSLSPGTYNFTVTNSAGCTSAATANVVINNVAGAPLAPSVNIVQPTCTVATATVTVTSPTAGLTFSIDGGPYTPYPAGGYILTAGSHTLTEQNSSNCVSPITDIIVNAQPPTPAAPAVNVDQPTCSVATGTITVTTSVGLTFSLDGAPYAAYPAGGYIVSPGSHSLIARNADGCVSAATNITVNTQPAPPSATATVGTITCNGGTTSLTVTATGGTGTIEYSLDGTNFQAPNIFTVPAGTYTVTVRDAIQCTATSNTVQVAEPAAITVTAAASSIACSGSTTITATATGGSGALEYSMNGGPYQSGNSFNVGPGTYTITVRAVSNPGCMAVSPPVVIAQSPQLSVVVNAKRIARCGGTTVVAITATGGTLPYASGIGNFTRGPGTYDFTVTDAAGCTATAQLTVEPPGCMELNVFPNPAGGTIKIDHSVAAAGSRMEIYAVNGSKVLTKAVPLNAFQTSIDVGKLAAGSYIVVYVNGSERKQKVFAKLISQ